MARLQGSVPFAYVAIDHSHSQQPVLSRRFPLFKRCGWWSIATWVNGRHSMAKSIYLRKRSWKQSKTKFTKMNI